MSSLQDLESRLGHVFLNRDLLRQALTHRSFGTPNNERLEFLGDAVLNCAVASLLFEQFAQLDEGDLSRLRSNLVKQSALADLAQQLELAGHLQLGEGERRSGGLRRPSILGDTLEALFGAIYLDGGFGAAASAISKVYAMVLQSIDPNVLGKDAKTLLQELLQGRKISLPVYQVVATHGAAHSQVFEVECSVPKLNLTFVGSGASRRAAEQSAAQQAYEHVHALSHKPGKEKRAA
jgi:ribonuclease III